MNNNQDIEFIYADADSYDNEIAELYSYTEVSEFHYNLKAFEEICSDLGVIPLWQSMSLAGRQSLIIKLCDQLDLLHSNKRMRAARALLYIAQGCWGEVQSDREQLVCARQNVFLLFDHGAWDAFVQLLFMEIDMSDAETQPRMTMSINMQSSITLRVILSFLYSLIETLRVSSDEDPDEADALRESFREELITPHSASKELFAVTLLNMVTRFCNNVSPHFPMRKVLLLLWKVLLFALGGLEELHKIKNNKRVEADLEPCSENTLAISRTMRASTPPLAQTDMTEPSNQKRRPLRRGLIKQSSLDESMNEIDMNPDDEGVVADVDDPPELPRPVTPRPGTPVSENKVNKGLPWVPKVRQKDIDSYLDSTRKKFVGFPLKGDRISLIGLPLPIHEGVEVLKKHMYVSLSEVQIKREEEISKNPISLAETSVPQVPAEVLYKAMYPTLSQCVIALLKILLATAPTAKQKADGLNLSGEIIPDDVQTTVIQSMKLRIDIGRHKEVLVKAVSGILLLLLKHFKVNHIYQFETMSQHLVNANCIPLILKFFNHNILGYVQTKNTIVLLDFPACVIGDPPEMTAEALEACTGSLTITDGDSPNNSPCGCDVYSSACCWRNMFASINLLCILNKLCKWKQNRIMVLCAFRSAPILRRTLRVKHAMFQLYVLKLLKMQTKYLGRQWRKSNMKTMSAIYQKVRHRLNDDWAYGNDTDARPWDYHGEENELKINIDKFNTRRYGTIQDPEVLNYTATDNYAVSVLGREVELAEEFKSHYEIWLQREVWNATIDWDQLLMPV